jgi:type IV pilus assembly protein PilB
VDLGFATERDVVQAKAEAENIPFVDLTKHAPEASAINVVPEHVVRKHNALPVKKDGQKLWVAMADPRNIVAQDDVRMVSRCQVIAMAAVPTDLEDAISRSYAGSGAASGGTGVVATAPMMGNLSR